MKTQTAAQAERCPELKFDVPSEYRLDNSVEDDSFPGHVRVRRTYKRGDGHEISALAGIESVTLLQGDVIGQMEAGDRQVTLRTWGPNKYLSAVWREAPEGSGCSLYVLLAGGLSEREFRRLVSTARVV